MNNKIKRVVLVSLTLTLLFTFGFSQEVMSASLSIDKAAYTIQAGGSTVGRVLFTGADTTIGGYLLLYMITPSVASVSPQTITIQRHPAGYGYVDSPFTLYGLSAGQTLFYVTAYYSNGSEIGIEVYANITVTDCPVSVSLEGSESGTLDLFRDFRDRVLAKSPEGRKMIRDYYRHPWEGCYLLIKHPDLLEKSRDILEQLLPVVESSLEGQAPELSQDQLAEIDAFMAAIERLASPALKKTVRRLRANLSDGDISSLF